MAPHEIAEYGTSSTSDSDSDSEESEIGSLTHCSTEKVEALPPPDLDSHEVRYSASSESIFHNPYRKEHELNICTLSRHILPSDNSEKQKKPISIEQRKICRRFAAKGRCRFENKCKFSHAVSESIPFRGCENHAESSCRSTLADNTGSIFYDDTDSISGERKKRKRPGLGNHLIPSKKVVAMYNRFSKNKT